MPSGSWSSKLTSGAMEPGTTVTRQPMSTRCRRMFHFTPKSIATTCGRRAFSDLGGTRRVLGKGALEPGLPGRGTGRHDLRRQVAADQAGAGAGAGDQASVVEVGGGEDPLEGPGQGSRSPRRTRARGVDPLDAEDAVGGQVFVQGPVGAMVAGPPAQLADDEPADPGAAALHVLGVDAVVADQGIGHRHDLAVIRRVGQDLLISGRTACVEDDLALGLAAGPERPAGEDRPIFER